MNKDQIVNALIANAKSPFDEDDRDYLMGLSINKLSTLATNAGIKKSPGGDSIDGGDDDGGEQLEDAAEQVKGKKFGSKSGATKNKGNDEPMDDEEEVDPKAAKGKGKAGMKKGPECNAAPTLDEYLETVPEAFRDVVTNGIRAHTAQKAKLVAAIVANKANIFTKEQLNAKGIQELHAIASLCRLPVQEAAPVQRRQPVANYAGLGDANYDLTANAGGADIAEEEALEMPVLNFSVKERGEEQD